MLEDIKIKIKLPEGQETAVSKFQGCLNANLDFQIFLHAFGRTQKRGKNVRRLIIVLIQQVQR